MGFFRTTKKAAPVAPVIIDQQEAIKFERGAAFKAIDSWYKNRNHSKNWGGDWDHIQMLWGYCRASATSNVAFRGEKYVCPGEVEFYLRLFDYVRMRKGRGARFGHGIYVSHWLPHAEKCGGDRCPRGDDPGSLPDDPRLIAALKKFGVDVTNLNLVRR